MIRREKYYNQHKERIEKSVPSSALSDHKNYEGTKKILAAEYCLVHSEAILSISKITTVRADVKATNENDGMHPKAW